MSNQPSTINHRQQKDILEILKADYQRFPENQTFDIYAQNVYFKDPLNEFNGVKRYQKMIGFLNGFFGNIEMKLHEITGNENTIKTEWTLNMTPPLPWKPRLSIPGWSELTVNEDNLIISHIDYWHISPWNVLRQNFFSTQKASQ
ncbi:DUF2358 domain-containing protein [Pleurocapsa sp. PCC 7319]|uniref:DUF2358 domain-containing protein n=1 Tax=Pleurocapsa sp. PCC 7319 TaxID=118161 RepID=UPI000348D65F|nr:DUF2358 domain-containing protein [Pleurocapsa sp. PCC 7319]